MTGGVGGCGRDVGGGDDGDSGRGGGLTRRRCCRVWGCCDSGSVGDDCGPGGGVGVTVAVGDKAGDDDAGSCCECAGGKGRSDSCCGYGTGQLGDGGGRALGDWVRANGVVKGLVSAERICGCDDSGCCCEYECCNGGLGDRDGS